MYHWLPPPIITPIAKLLFHCHYLYIPISTIFFLPPFRTIKFRYQTSSASAGSSTGLKRVAAEEIIEEIKQEQPDQGPTDDNDTTITIGESTASSMATAVSSVPAIGGGKVKKLDTTNSYSIGVRKSSLSNLVVKKKQPTTTMTTPAVSVASTGGGEPSKTEPVSAKTMTATTTMTVASSSSSSTVSVASAAVTTTVNSAGSAVSGLGLLGAYSDSDNSSDGNEWKLYGGVLDRNKLL